jgi:tetratricopeptide (TPR) repeat protein
LLGRHSSMIVLYSILGFVLLCRMQQFKTILIVCFSALLYLISASCGGDLPADYSTKENIRAALIANPNNPEALHARAKFFIKESKVDSALIDMLDALDQDSSKSDYFVTLGDIYLIKNQTRFTRQALEKAIKLEPDSKVAHMKLAELFLYVEMRQEAINEINEVLKRDKNNPKAYYLKGIIYKESGDTSLAISSFLTTTEQDPKYLLAFEQLGLIFANSGNPRAINFYETAIKLDPKNSLTRYNLGMFFQENGAPDKAAEVYKALLAIDPKFSNAYYNLGFIEIEFNKNANGALPYFVNAEKSNPSFAASVYMQGVCYEKLGKESEAIKNFQRCLKLNPEFELASDGLKRLGASY